MAAPGPWSPKSDNHQPHRKPPSRQRPVWPWIVFGFAVLIVGVIALMQAFPGTMDNADNRGHLIYSLMLVSVIGLGAMIQWVNEPRKALRDAGIWAIVIAVMVLAYSVRHEAGLLYNRVAGDLNPSQPRMVDGDLVIQAGRDDHFHIDALVNGRSVRFLIDTGASDIVLNIADAKRLGFDLESLRFTKIYHTANGIVRGAPVRLDEVSLGGIVMKDLSASVNEGALSQSLLGMSFLQRLQSYSVSGDRLTLRP